MRVSTTFIIPDSEPVASSKSSGLLAETLERDMPANVERATRIFIETSALSLDNRTFSIDIAFTDPDFVEIFKPVSPKGTPLFFEADPSSIYLSETQARLIFGEKTAIGRTLQFPKTGRLRTVRGIFADFPSDSHMKLDALTFLDVGQFEDRAFITSQWTSLQVYTYVKLHNTGALSELRQQAKALVDRNIDFQFSGRPELATSDIIKLVAEPVSEIHLGKARGGAIKPSGNRSIVNLLAAVGVFLILVTALNFGILFAALVRHRNAETKLRKTLGANSNDILLQFGSSSALTLLMSVIISIPVTWLILVLLNTLAGISMSEELKSSSGPLVICFTLFTLLVIGLSLIPAMRAAQNKLTMRQSFRLKVGEVTLDSASFYGFAQNLLSVSLITLVVILFAQSRHLSDLPLRFEIEDIHIAKGFKGDISTPLRSLEASYSSSGNARSLASASSGLPLRGYSSNNIALKGDRPIEKQIQTIHVSPNFLSLLSVKRLAGDDFTDQLARGATGPNEVIVNRAFLGLYGLGSSQDAIKRRLSGAVRPNGPVEEMIIIGVVDNLKLRGSQSEPEPAIFRRQPFDAGRVIFSKEKPIESKPTFFEMTLRNLFPTDAVDVRRLTDGYALLNADLRRTNAAFAFFAILAIILTLMGIFGVSQLSIIKNRRTIALKKVLGAKSSTLVIIDLIRSALPVLLTALIAIPVVYLLASDWLSQFPSRVNVRDLLPQFLAIITLAVLVKWLVTAASLFSTLTTNPSEVFRHN